MATENQNNPMNANLKEIPRFLKDLEGYLKTVRDKRKVVESSLDALVERKSEIIRVLEEKEAQELARKKEEERRLREIAEAISKPLVEEPAAEEKVSEEKTSEVKAETKSEPIAEEKIAEPVKTEVTTPEKTVKPDKPQIRVYIPPQENRPQIRKYIPPTNDRPATSSRPPLRSGGGYTPGTAPRPPIAMPSKDNKKKVVTPEKKVFDEKKTTNKRTLTRKGFLSDSSSIQYDEVSGEITKIRTRRFGSDKRKNFTPNAQEIEQAVITTENLTVRLLSEKIGKTFAEIGKVLFALGIMKTINDNIDFDTASLVASELGVTLSQQIEKTSEEKLFEIHDEADSEELLKERPPIVTIMGHVDHGKTSILDYIRKARVVDGEAGGITQHIGAYTINQKGKQITFLDTPGHEAFTSMRARGANVTDIAIIVVAADDGIMPQTVEAIHHAKAANCPIIVAVNKMDKPTAEPDKVLQQMTEHEILPEEWGGTIPVVKVSAKTGSGIEELLETILVTSEILELKANPDRKAKGTIIEAKLDKGKGPIATILVQNGTLRVGDNVVAGTVTGRVRAMINDKGQNVTQALPSTPVSILGLQEVPNAGDQLMSTDDQSLISKVIEMRKRKEQAEKNGQNSGATLENMFEKLGDQKLKHLSIILKADVQGSVEAVRQALERLSNEEVKISILHSGVGAINESDVMLAKTGFTIIAGFNVRPDTKAKAEAERSGVDIRTYRIIYDVIDDIKRAVNGMLAPKFKEQYLGRAEVREIFKITGVGTVAGCMVKDGKIVRNAKIRLLRDNVIVTEGEIASLKRMKDDAKEVAAGYECGVGILNYDDVNVGDVIEAFRLEQVSGAESNG